MLLAGALFAFYLPWISNASAALSANAYDLAEWIVPAVRGGSMPMLPPFLLRAALPILAFLFALNARRTSTRLFTMISAVVASILALTAGPPLEFFRGNWDDSNQQQQLFLMILAMIGLGVIFALRDRPLPWRVIEGGIALLGIGAAVWGVSMAIAIISSANISAPLGLGAILYVLCLAVYGVTLFFASKPEKKITRQES